MIMISPVCGWMTIFIASSQRTSRVAGAGLLREAPETSGGPIEAPGFGPHLPSTSPPRPAPGREPPPRHRKRKNERPQEQQEFAGTEQHPSSKVARYPPLRPRWAKSCRLTHSAVRALAGQTSFLEVLVKRVAIDGFKTDR